jgi:hypothetical protein
MSEDSKGARWPTAKRGTSEGWSDPPIWSPWNFQFPNPNRKRQGHVDREAPANAHARDETIERVDASGRDCAIKSDQHP